MENLKRLAAAISTKRNFEVKDYVEKKIKHINDFFSDNNLDSAVIGISGGVDSAVAFALLEYASRKENSPIKKILALAMPIYGNGTTNQLEAKKKATRFIDNYIFNNNEKYNEKIYFHYVDLTDAYNAYAFGMNSTSDPWANGQLASIVRTPCLYYHAAILQSEGLKSIVVGTTNRDEGSYIGFFGKASDAMVDLQPIADIHKSEVYQVAKYLNVTEEIINAVPAGDVHDGRVDEEMIGAPYWFLEMYLILKNFGDPLKLFHFGEVFDSSKFINKDRLTAEEIKSFEDYSNAIETIHNKNKHKYQVGNPAHFIDVMQRTVLGGWQ